MKSAVALLCVLLVASATAESNLRANSNDKSGPGSLTRSLRSLSPASDLARAILLQVASEAEGSDAVQRLSELIDKIRDSLTNDLDSARQSWQTQSASCEDSTATLNSTIANAKSRKANFETQLDAKESEIAGLEGEVAALEDAVDDLGYQIGNTTLAKGNATSVRNSQKEDNSQRIAAHEDALDAISEAETKVTNHKEMLSAGSDTTTTSTEATTDPGLDNDSGINTGTPLFMELGESVTKGGDANAFIQMASDMARRVASVEDVDALHTLLNKLKTKLQDELDRLRELEEKQSLDFTYLEGNYTEQLTELGDSKTDKQTTLAQKKEALGDAETARDNLQNSIDSEQTTIDQATANRAAQMEQCDTIDATWEQAKKDNSDALAVLDAVDKIIDERLGASEMQEQGVDKTMDKALE
eukprot:CAMPEP_0196770440 /NCGR_PEP_ID=MMETSP1104-20130614/1131_1 /TAXON_ID=33652 /ORGANISM="Cafeteria sp., Strain Caron Lab Isolate" /LENGTH=415 /DNA_ID=CAMNT_0042140553 /DNA_START=13 /DNA_END=1260 /DNA_ORIENTATION=-